MILVIVLVISVPQFYCEYLKTDPISLEANAPIGTVILNIHDLFSKLTNSQQIMVKFLDSRLKPYIDYDASNGRVFISQNLNFYDICETTELNCKFNLQLIVLNKQQFIEIPIELSETTPYYLKTPRQEFFFKNSNILLNITEKVNINYKIIINGINSSLSIDDDKKIIYDLFEYDETNNQLIRCDYFEALSLSNGQKIALIIRKNLKKNKYRLKLIATLSQTSLFSIQNITLIFHNFLPQIDLKQLEFEKTIYNVNLVLDNMFKAPKNVLQLEFTDKKIKNNEIVYLFNEQLNDINLPFLISNGLVQIIQKPLNDSYSFSVKATYKLLSNHSSNYYYENIIPATCEIKVNIVNRTFNFKHKSITVNMPEFTPEDNVKIIELTGLLNNKNNVKLNYQLSILGGSTLLTSNQIYVQNEALWLKNLFDFHKKQLQLKLQAFDIENIHNQAQIIINLNANFTIKVPKLLNFNEKLDLNANNLSNCLTKYQIEQSNINEINFVTLTQGFNINSDGCLISLNETINETTNFEIDFKLCIYNQLNCTSYKQYLRIKALKSNDTESFVSLLFDNLPDNSTFSLNLGQLSRKTFMENTVFFIGFLISIIALFIILISIILTILIKTHKRNKKALIKSPNDRQLFGIPSLSSNSTINDNNLYFEKRRDNEVSLNLSESSMEIEVSDNITSPIDGYESYNDLTLSPPKEFKQDLIQSTSFQCDFENNENNEQKPVDGLYSVKKGILKSTSNELSTSAVLKTLDKFKAIDDCDLVNVNDVYIKTETKYSSIKRLKDIDFTKQYYNAQNDNLVASVV